MVDKISLVRIKCGQIFFLADDKFSWTCEFCDKDFYSLEDFRPHINEHFPKSLSNIKREDSISCGSDSETLPLDDLRVDSEHCLKTPQNIKKEDSISFDSECVNIYPEIRDEVMSYEDIMKYEATSQSITKECSSSRLAENQFTKKTIKNEPSERKQPEQIQSNNGNAYEISEGTKVSRTNRNRIKNKLAKPDRFSYPAKPKIPSKSRKMTFECSFCKKLFGDRKELNDHENVHTGKRPHQCEICSTTFASVSNMRRHVKVHKDDRRHVCQVCKKRFIVRFKLDIHVREKHLPDNDPRRYFPCELCDAKFKSYAQLYIHRRVHRKNTTVYICYYCKQEFQRREHIVLHIKIHSSNNT